MRSLIEMGVMSNMFGYITPSDIVRLVTEINPILEAYDFAARGNVYAYNDISWFIRDFTHANGYDWSNISYEQQYNMFKIHLMMQKTQLIEEFRRTAELALQPNPFRTR